ncbi:MAG: FAD-binding oxidoreductase [Pseudomonadota bacterium]
MKRLFADHAYGPGPRAGCWWDDTCDMPAGEPMDGGASCDVVIVGAGFTGVSAALHLARAGVSVIVLDAQRIGWGASGRNGGFCCLGGGIATDAVLDRRFGRAGRLAWREAEKAAVHCVDDLIGALKLDVDRHSKGETLLAHTARQARGFDIAATRIEENHGVTPDIIDRPDLMVAGFGGPFHRALTTPIGFGLNPRKYLAGLVAAAQAAGVRFCDETPVEAVQTDGVATPRGTVRAGRVIVATNGYSSEDIPGWMAARYLPVQSNVLVTASISPKDRDAQGWTTDQMCYDTRNLLHYFRMLPDGRFLFGMRGGLRSSPAADRGAQRRILRDFRRMFPAWHHIPVTHAWSGMACLAPGLLPCVGPMPGQPTTLVGFAYHGNGVAMGSLTGSILADLVLGKTPAVYPDAMRPTPQRFPLGRWRRALLPPAYALSQLVDALP